MKTNKLFKNLALTFALLFDAFINAHGKNFGILSFVGYYPDNCANIPAPDCDPCEPYELGRVRAAGFIDNAFVFPNNDPTDPANWIAGIDANQIFVYPKTHGEVAEPTEKTGPGFGATIETLLAYEFNAKVAIPSYKNNWEHFNLIKNARNYKFFYCTSTQIHITDVPVVIIPGAQVPDDLTGMVNWMAKVKWQSQNLTQPLDIPAGLFDECFDA